MRFSVLTSGLVLLAGCVEDSVDSFDSTPTDSGIDATTLDAGPSVKHLELKFAARLTDRGELACGQAYAGQGSAGSDITPKDFRFYVQSVTLRATTGEDVPLEFDDLADGGFQTPEVSLIDFTTGGGDCEGGPTASNVRIQGVVPANLRYNGVHVVIGVPETLNHGDPVVAPAPLQAPGASWDWVAGYRFLIAEVLNTSVPDAGTHHVMDAGQMAEDAGHAGASDAGGHVGHGSVEPGLGFIHLGSTGCTKDGEQYRCTNANRAEFTLTGFDPERDTIVADLGALFATADLSGAVQCHGSGPACAPMFEQLGVDVDSGAPSGMQRVFSVSSPR